MNDNPINGKNEEEEYFPGIYNYCDRWCQKCAFNSRCLNYSLEEEISEHLPPGHAEDALSRIKLIFEEISSMLDSFIEKEGIDLESLPEMDEEKEEEIRKIIEEHPITKLAVEYESKVNDWFKKNNKNIEKFVIELRESVEEGKATGDPIDDILSLHDVIDIIIYYFTFIEVKLRRAIRDKHETFFDAEFRELDKNLSAKLALIGIDRSYDAWEILDEIVAGKGNMNASSFVKLLDDLRNLVEVEFPDARSFIRPYFDSIEE
ncbi:MAG: hypothetical protein D6830_04500 [Ignavibacteria bacterium]|nr:MAG: hypothetical protein D6830_04500 [Ignavibacteria bacterium]